MKHIFIEIERMMFSRSLNTSCLLIAKEIKMQKSKKTLVSISLRTLQMQNFYKNDDD